MSSAGRTPKSARPSATRQTPVSLEKPIGDGEDSELADVVADETTASPFDTASHSLVCADLGKALGDAAASEPAT